MKNINITGRGTGAKMAVSNNNVPIILVLAQINCSVLYLLL
ncbi:MAG: hypothetical protein PV340_00905 [Wolbachia sp.]|nr:hypothetical protein [Wolbachia sp.]